MDAAIEAALCGATLGEVPVGAAVIVGDTVVATAWNETILHRDLTRHAELVAIHRAMRALEVDRLSEATLCVTLEPCAQCAGSIVLARVARVTFGAFDPKAGMAGSVGDILRHPRLNHRPEVRGGVREEECASLLTDFFLHQRR